MTNPQVAILIFAVAAGQLIKLPFGTHGGILLLDIIVLASCLFGLINLKFNLKQPPLVIKAALIFTLIASLSLILTPLTLNSNEYLTAASYIMRFTSYILFGWLLIAGAFPATLQKVDFIVITSAVILSILGLLQFILLPDLEIFTTQGWDPHYYRIVSTFLDPNFFGGFLVLSIIFLLQKLNVPKNWYLLIFALFYLSIILTFSRSTYLAFAVSLIVLSILNKSIRTFILTSVLCLGLVLGFSIYHQNIAQPKGVDKQKSAESRLGSWQQGLVLFEQHPILGVGFNGYRYALMQYHLGSTEDIESHGGSSNDSSLLHVASTTGIIGLFSYLFFLSAIFWVGWKNYRDKNPWGVALLALLSGIISQSFFINILFYPPILIFLVLVLSRQKM